MSAPPPYSPGPRHKRARAAHTLHHALHQTYRNYLPSSQEQALCPPGFCQQTSDEASVAPRCTNGQLARA